MPGLGKIAILNGLICALFTGPIAAAELAHHWSDSAKEAVGTAYGAKSPVWFTVGHGILNEVYYPRVDRAQVGDSQLLFANVPGARFLEEKRDFSHQISHPTSIPRPIIHSVFDNGKARIEFTKEIVTDPQAPVLRTRYRFKSLPQGTRVYILHKPTAGNDAALDRGRVQLTSNGDLLFTACDTEQSGNCQGVTTTARVERASVGIVGETDGWQDLDRNGHMVNELAQNGPGNIALMAQLKTANEFEVVLSFGQNQQGINSALRDTFHTTFTDVRREFDDGWQGYQEKLAAAPWLKDVKGSALADVLWNAAIIKSHEDKSNPGAIIASLSIPYIPSGGGHPDGKDTGGYHLVWPRDLFKSALALLRLGDTRTAYNALAFMSRMERNGRMSQNTWVDGKPFWTGEQMDQEAYPVLLAYELSRAGVRIEGDLKSFLDRRVSRLQNSTGWTGQERWEEAGGFSPNTIAVMAAALSRAGDMTGAQRLLEVALSKTVSRNGPLSVSPYFIRIAQNGQPDAGQYINIANGGPSLPEFQVVDGGFLEWLRWFPHPEQTFGELGRQLDQVITDTIAVYDDPSNGAASSYDGIPLYRRYTGDAYGMRNRGGPWPILTAERALPLIRDDAAEGLKFVRHVRELWGAGDLCPEQLDTNMQPMPFGASPLVWCHAEMIELSFRSLSNVSSR